MGFDASLLLWIQDVLRTPSLDSFMAKFTAWGDHGILWIALTLVLLIIPKTRRTGLMCCVSLILSLVICNGLLKNLFDRPRPYTQIPDLRLIVKEASDASFPSGHACSAFCVGTVCLKQLPKRAGIPVIAAATLMALSRLYVGIHYPTDVIAGTLLGILLGMAAIAIVNTLDKKRQLRRQLPSGDHDQHEDQ